MLNLESLQFNPKDDDQDNNKTLCPYHNIFYMSSAGIKNSFPKNQLLDKEILFL
jgi:hypothetical protein